MYQNPTLFHPVTNRESWSPVIQLADDDTGQLLNLTYTSGTGTFASWSIAVSATLQGPALFSTNSVSSLKIGTGVFNAVVGTGLAIIAGKFVAFSALAGTASMQGVVNSYNGSTGALQFTVSTMAVALEIRRDRFGTGQRNDTGYVSFFDYGNVDDWGPLVSLSIGSGITIIDVGTLQIYVSETQMRGLSGRTHIVAATLTSADGIDTRQLFLGRLPVLDGYMTN